MKKINGEVVVAALASQHTTVSTFDAICITVTVALVLLMAVR